MGTGGEASVAPRPRQPHDEQLRALANRPPHGELHHVEQPDVDGLHLDLERLDLSPPPRAAANTIAGLSGLMRTPARAMRGNASFRAPAASH